MDNESLYIYGATLMMVIGTFSCRELPLLLLRGRKLPDWFNIWLKYIPTAIFGALIFPVHPYRHFRRADFPRHFPER